MHRWLHSNQFCKTCHNCFCPSWRCSRCLMTLRELSQQSNNSCKITLHKLQTWTKTVLTCFNTKNECWAAIPDPIWTTNIPNERNINMLSSTDNNFIKNNIDNVGANWLTRFWYALCSNILSRENNNQLCVMFVTTRTVIISSDEDCLG